MASSERQHDTTGTTPTTDDAIVMMDSRYIRGPGGVLEDFRLRKAPRWMIYIAIVAVAASWIPLAVAFLARNKTMTQPRIHLIQDMDNQTKYRPQDANPIFADRRAMRPPIAGTVARGHLDGDPHYHQGFVLTGATAQAQPPPPAEGANQPAQPAVPAAQFFDGYPRQIQEIMDDPAKAEQLLRRGQERFNIYCAPCHGQDGYGGGPIHVRADTLARNGVQGMSWVQPKSMHDADVRARPNGHLFNTITNGIRNMGGYGGQINIADRWAIVAYVRTLQFSQAARPEAVPAEQRGQLK
jgi:mono/diheme cytochrome c family protein